MSLPAVLIDELRAIVGNDAVVASVEGRMTYECDMHTFYKGAPDVVVLPTATRQVQAIVQACRRAKVPVVPRGSGTGLIGGAMAPQGGVMVGMNRMASILEVDLPNRCATVQPGLINLWLSNAVYDQGWFFAPDPSSQMVSSIGGNVSTNAGGPHCLKYGITLFVEHSVRIQSDLCSWGRQAGCAQEDFDPGWLRDCCWRLPWEIESGRADLNALRPSQAESGEVYDAELRQLSFPA